MSWNYDVPNVVVRMLVLEFQLHGCASLKEKRSRLNGLRQRFGKNTGIAVSESDHQNSHGRAQWSFVAMASAGHVVEQGLQQVEEFAALSLDAELLSANVFELN